MPSFSSHQALRLPGDQVLAPPDLPQTGMKSALKLGPGLHMDHGSPGGVTATFAGSVRADTRKNAVWIENNSGRYIPRANDVVIVTVHHSSTDYFHVALTPHSAFALLPHLAFENATKKTRPQLAAGALVYARVTSSNAHNRFQEAELACVNPSTGKPEGMGELKGGMVFTVSLSMAARLLVRKQREDGGVTVLELLAKRWPFEVAVGRNGYVWVDAGDVRKTVVVGRALVETDKGGLEFDGQERVVKMLCKELGTD